MSEAEGSSPVEAHCNPPMTCMLPNVIDGGRTPQG
jgi:hypothetical protein